MIKVRGFFVKTGVQSRDMWQKWSKRNWHTHQNVLKKTLFRYLFVIECLQPHYMSRDISRTYFFYVNKSFTFCMLKTWKHYTNGKQLKTKSKLWASLVILSQNAWIRRFYLRRGQIFKMFSTPILHSLGSGLLPSLKIQMESGVNWQIARKMIKFTFQKNFLCKRDNRYFRKNV